MTKIVNVHPDLLRTSNQIIFHKRLKKSVDNKSNKSQNLLDSASLISSDKTQQSNENGNFYTKKNFADRIRSILTQAQVDTRRCPACLFHSQS